MILKVDKFIDWFGLVWTFSLVTLTGNNINKCVVSKPMKSYNLGQKVEAQDQGLYPVSCRDFGGGRVNRVSLKNQVHSIQLSDPVRLVTISEWANLFYPTPEACSPN